MKHLLNFGLMFGFLLMAATGFSQFEGYIKFTKTTGSVATTYKYYVKGYHVRVEELTEDGEVTGVMLVDTKNSNAIALNPERGLYMDVPNGRSLPEVTADVAELKNRKEMHGYQCNEIRVTSKSDDRIVSYWCAKGDFDFFLPLLKTLNRKDKLALYFREIEGMEGVFPMIGEERKLDGTVVSKLAVETVTKASIADDFFAIPAGYTKFEK